MIRKEVMETAKQCIEEDRELLRLLASEEISNKKILQRAQN